MEELIAELGVDRRHETAVVDGIELAYDSVGEGTPVLCLHATGHGGGDFGPLRERLTAQAPGRYRVLRLDWPGQGRSARDHQPASARRYAELLGPFLDAVGIESVVLLGNSIGGAAALAFAAAQPQRVRALILSNPGGLAPVDPFAQRFCRAMVAFFNAGARGARWFGPAFALYYSQILAAPPARERRRQIVAAGYAIAPVLAEAWASFGEAEADLRPLAKQIECPVWFPWAKNDRIIAFARSREAVESFANAQVDFFPAGHAPFLEAPDAFTTAFLENGDRHHFPSENGACPQFLHGRELGVAG